MHWVITQRIEWDIWQECVFSPDLFNLYRVAILRELEVLSGLITGGHILNIVYANGGWMELTKTSWTSRKCNKERGKNGLTINCKKREFMGIIWNNYLKW